MEKFLRVRTKTLHLCVVALNSTVDRQVQLQEGEVMAFSIISSLSKIKYANAINISVRYLRSSRIQEEHVK
jgi:hypothetical protein